jgi:hypothetical protein
MDYTAPPVPSVKILRTVLFALLFSLLLGFALGTVLRMRFERPTIYIGAHDADSGWTTRRGPSVPADPLQIGDASPVILDAGHDEEQVG